MDAKQYKVVIVEDNASLAEIYQVLLETNGFKVSVAHDGRVGLDLILKTRPDLVLLDLMMPIMSGDQVLSAVRADAECKNTKVIMLTNISEAEAPAGIEQMGFSRYIVKANLQSEQLPDICRATIGESLEENMELKSL